MNAPYLAAIALGFFGSLHCVGMCGPIVLALPGKSALFSRFMTLRLVYNAGRVLTYAWLGLMLGLFGRQIQWSGYQAQLSIVSGLLILLFAFFPYLSSRLKLQWQPGRFINGFLGEVLYKPTYGGQFLTGLLNGLLPCGLVYLALAGALLVGDPLVSSGFMALFGLGTLPAMLAVALLGRQLFGRFRPLFRKISPIIALVMATLFILRGLSLGIPYISPQLTHPAQPQTEICH